MRNRRSTPLNDAPARTWRIWAARRRAPASFMTVAGNFPEGRRTDGKAVVTCCGGSHGDVAGAESGASSAERSTGEHGNHPGSARGSRRQRGRSGWAHRRPSGPGWGGAVVVVAGVTTCHGARESRTRGEGRQQSRGVRMLQGRKMHWRMSVPHHRVPIGPRRRVSEMQANFHRCAFVHDGRPCGEPGAVRVARRVRRAAWGNGPAAMPAPRPRPTQPSGSTCHGRSLAARCVVAASDTICSVTPGSGDAGARLGAGGVEALRVSDSAPVARRGGAKMAGWPGSGAVSPVGPHCEGASRSTTSLL